MKYFLTKANMYLPLKYILIHIHIDISKKIENVSPNTLKVILIPNIYILR